MRLHYKTKSESHGDEEEFGWNSMSSEHFLAKRRIGSLSGYESERKVLTTKEHKRRRLQ